MTKKGAKHPHPRGCRCPIHAGGRRSPHRSNRGTAGAAPRRKNTIPQMIARFKRTVVSVAKSVLPTGLIVAGSVLPVVSSQGTGFSAVSSFTSAAQGDPIDLRLEKFATNLSGNVRATWAESAILIGGGIVAHKVLSTIR